MRRSGGAAYEYLIKFFADSAGKKAGEFYTPAEVVRTLVEIVEPAPGMSVYDPTCGSGGMLIQTRDYLRECGGDPRDLVLAGQESIGTTWSICKMNMLLHDIAHADIRRYVDNAPPPEPHDVRAHLHGGVPLAEVEALAHYWHNYPGLRAWATRSITRPTPARRSLPSCAASCARCWGQPNSA